MTDDGPCELMFGFEVIDGKDGSVSLNGVRFVVGGKYPGPIHEGSGDVVLFVDEKASPEQVDAVATIVTGQAGGMPWEAIAGTVGSFEGPVRKPIEMTVNGNRSSFRIPGVVEMRQTPIKDVVSGDEKGDSHRLPQGRGPLERRKHLHHIGHAHHAREGRVRAPGPVLGVCGGELDQPAVGLPV